MLTEDAISCIRNVCKFGSVFRSAPFMWDEKTKSVSIRKGSLWQCKCFLVAEVCYAIFSIARLYQYLVIKGRPLHECTIPMYYSIAHYYFALSHIGYMSRHHEVANFLTKFVEFDTLYSNDTRNGTELVKSGKVVMIFCIMILCQAGFQGLSFLIFPHNPNFIYSLVDDNPYFTSIWVRLVFAIFEGILVFQNWAVILVGGLWLIFIESVSIWNSNIRSNVRTVWVGEKRIYFQSIALLMSRFNDSFSRITMPGQKIGILAGAVVCLYGTIRFYGKIHIVAYMIMPLTVCIILIFIFMFYRVAGALHSGTQESIAFALGNILEDNKHVGSTGNGSYSKINTDVERKSMQSIPEVAIRIVDFYIITRETTLTYCSTIVSNTITLLLA